MQPTTNRFLTRDRPDPRPGSPERPLQKHKRQTLTELGCFSDVHQQQHNLCFTERCREDVHFFFRSTPDPPGSRAPTYWASLKIESLHTMDQSCKIQQEVWKCSHIKEQLWRSSESASFSSASLPWAELSFMTRTLEALQSSAALWSGFRVKGVLCVLPSQGLFSWGSSDSRWSTPV